MGSQPVLLGFMDAAMGEGEGHYSINKIGGDPDWAGAAPSSSPKCGLCSQALIQVCQVYAPLSSSAYHRTLHLLACPQPPCWNQQASWSCFRSQLKEPEQVDAEKSTEVHGKVTDWLGDADDWGEEEEVNDPNGNETPGCWNNSSFPSTPSTPSPGGAAGYQNNLNINSISLSPLTLTSGDGNANSRGKRDEDSSGALGGVVARAEVEEEGDDEDCCVAMEELEKPETDIPSLFFAANRPIKSSSGELKIAAHYLWVGEEKEGDSGSGEVVKDEERLLQEYKAREALEGAMGQGGKGAAKGGSGGEGWEKVVPTHGDELLHKMVEIIQKNPGQVLRYTRQCGVPPLLLQPVQEMKVPLCRHCGSSTTFELQLLPSLVAQLRVAGGEVEGPPVEFGTVLVFSCLASCWGEGGPREETVIVQGETM